MTGQTCLFEQPEERLPGVWHLPRFADPAVLEKPLSDVVAAAAPRHMSTPRGATMSVAMTNCGSQGWVSDRRGYRYQPIDPLDGAAWPPMPAAFMELATRAAAQCGFAGFAPDVCLINRYRPGDRMGAHQDRDESAFHAPIVSVSLGIPARFFVVGPERRGRATPIDLSDGDVIVFGGVARLHFHGVRPLKPAVDPRFGAVRWNLTFRQI